MQLDFGKLVRKINSMNECMRDIELHRRLRDIFSNLGIPSFIFSTFSLDASGFASSYRFLVGCSPEWIQIYQHRHWYSNDPHFQYARFNTSPVTGSAIPITSAGQREMRATARLYGFCSNLIVPAHSRATSLIGVLHVANSIEIENGGEACLMEWQALLRAIAGTLLDVRVQLQHQIMVERFGLDERELAALQFVLAGSPAQEVAASLGLSIASVYSMYSKVNEKLGTNRINETARLAQQYGLL